MEKKLRQNYPAMPRKVLDDLARKEYYKYNNIAIPAYVDASGMYYDKVDGQVFRVRLDDLNGIGKLSNGQYIVGNGQYAHNVYLLENIKDLEEHHRIQNSMVLTASQKEQKLNQIYDRVSKRMTSYYTQEKGGELTAGELTQKATAWLRTPLEYFEVVDITTQLNDRMLSYLSAPAYRDVKASDWLTKLQQFYKLVTIDGPEDFKSNQSRDNTIFNEHSVYIYNGELVDADALANIAYGFFGEYLGISNTLLKEGANIAQKWSERNLFVSDDPRDAYRVQQGRKIYINGSYKQWLQKQAG